MNPRNNEFTINLSKAPIKSSDFPTPTFCSSFCDPILNPAPFPVFALAKYIDEDLGKTIKLTLKSIL